MERSKSAFDMKLCLYFGYLLLNAVTAGIELQCTMENQLTNMLMDEHNIVFTIENTLEACKAQCLNNVDCKSLDYLRAEKLCYQNDADSITVAPVTSTGYAFLDKVCGKVTDGSALESTTQHSMMSSLIGLTSFVKSTSIEITPVSSYTKSDTQEGTILIKTATGEITTRTEGLTTQEAEPEIQTQTRELHATDFTTKESENLDLDWEIWTSWTSCYASRESTNDFETMRIKLCSVSDDSREVNRNESCPYSLNGIVGEQQISLWYAVQVEECVPDVDGVWINWTQWSTCSASCGGGTTFRQRVCAGQSGHGLPCEGQATQHDFCEREQCPSGGTSGNSVLKRRGELLPTEVYTESDSYTSNICISTTAIAILILIMCMVFVLDFLTVRRLIATFCWPRLKNKMFG